MLRNLLYTLSNSVLIIIQGIEMHSLTNFLILILNN